MRRASVRAFVMGAGLVLGTAVQAGGQAPDDRPVDASIRATLDQYSTAFESLDAAAVKKVQPSIDVENLKTVFRQLRTLQVSIDDIRILSTEPLVTRVSCRVTQTLTPRAGSKQTMAVARVIRLHKQANGWVIDAFER